MCFDGHIIRPYLSYAPFIWKRWHVNAKSLVLKKKLWIYLGVKVYIKNDTFFMLRNIETVLWHVNLTPPQSFAGQGGFFWFGLVWFGFFFCSDETIAYSDTANI